MTSAGEGHDTTNRSGSDERYETQNGGNVVGDHHHHHHYRHHRSSSRNDPESILRHLNSPPSSSFLW